MKIGETREEIKLKDSNNCNNKHLNGSATQVSFAIILLNS